MRNADPVIAILTADLHLSDEPPPCRSQEPDWYAAMERQLVELEQLRREHSCVVITAGDIFHHWRPSPRLLQFAIRHAPRAWYAVPGQHDLPNHAYTRIGESGYGVLVAADVLHTLTPGNAAPTTVATGTRSDVRMHLYGFPWGHSIFPPKAEIVDAASEHDLHVAVIHRYIWIRDHGYHNAPADGLASSYAHDLEGYDVALFGDNHKSFAINVGSPQCCVVNPGTFYRRNADDATAGIVYLLHASGTVSPCVLDTSRDKFIRPETVEIPTLPDLRQFLNAMAEDAGGPVDFRVAMRRYVAEGNGLSPRAGQILLEAIHAG